MLGGGGVRLAEFLAQGDQGLVGLRELELQIGLRLAAGLEGEPGAVQLLLQCGEPGTGFLQGEMGLMLHMAQVAYYLKRMSETKEGNLSLLDSTLVLAGARGVFLSEDGART